MGDAGRKLSLLAAVVCAAGVLGCTASGHREENPLAMHIEGVHVDPRTATPIVLLEEQGGKKRLLPIWIGGFEAQSIQLAIERVPSPRPNTHDLIKRILEGVEGELVRVVITEIHDRTYYAVLEVEVDGRSVDIDSRPSDAIAIAIRTGTPVFATEQVLRQAESPPNPGGALDIQYVPPASGPEPQLVH